MSCCPNQSTSAAPALLSAVASASLSPLLLSLLVSVPSVALYIAEVAIIVRGMRTQFKSSFFRLFAIKAIANLLGYVGSFLGQRFGRLGVFLPLYLRLPSPVLALFYFLVVYPYHLENAGTAALLLNRFTAIALPVKHEQLWKKALPWACAVMLLLPLPVTYQVLVTHEYVRVQPDGTYTLYFDKQPNASSMRNLTGNCDSQQWDNSEIAAISGLLFCAICLAINVATLVAYRQKRNGQSGTQSGDQQRETENKLTVYTVCTFLSQLFVSLYLVLLYLASSRSAQWRNGQLLFLAVYNQMPWATDLCTLAVPAWLLLWASPRVRKGVVALAKKAKLSVFSASPQASTAAQQAPRLAWNAQN